MSVSAPRLARADALTVRPVEARDLDAVIALDAAVTGLSKPDYWYELFHRYGTRGRQQRFFFVADADGRIDGSVLGEVRDWEFGSAPNSVAAPENNFEFATT